MKTKIFNKYSMVFFLILLLSASGVKIHSLLTRPKVSDWNYHQLQKIDHSKTTKTNFSFAVFGDNKNSVKTFENLISKLNNDNVLFAIDDGDLVYDGELAKYKFFLNQVHHLDKPLLTVVGNHDIKEKGRACYYELFGPFYYSFSIENSYFIILDDSNEKNLDDAQFAWLKKELKISQNYQNRFVFMHVPLYDPRKGKDHCLRDLNFAKRLNNLFDRSHITMLFCSHIHAYYRGVWGKTPYIITGGGGAELAGSDPAHYFYHYVKATVRNKSVKYSVVRLRTPELELLDRWAHDAWIYIYAFFAINFIDVLLTVAVIYLSSYIILLNRKGHIFHSKKNIRGK